MTPIHNLKGRNVVHNGIIVWTEFRTGMHGVIRVIMFDKLQVMECENTHAKVLLQNAVEWHGLMEPADWDAEQRAVEPYARHGDATYLASYFAKLRIIPTNNGSRFLSAKEVPHDDITELLAMADGQHPTVRTETRTFDSPHELLEYPHLDRLFRQMGVPLKNRETIITDIVKTLVQRTAEGA
jgi:hypothetical protein